MARAETMLALLIRWRHLSRVEVVTEFARIARELGCSATLSVTQLDRLRFGNLLGEPRPATVRVLERQFGRNIRELLAPAGLINRTEAAAGAHDPRSASAGTVEELPHAGDARQQPAVLLEQLTWALLTGDLWTEKDPVRLATLASNADGSRHITLAGGSGPQDQLDWQVSMAARRALRFSASVDGSNVGAETLDQLASEIQRIATEYQLSPIHTIVGDLVNLQDVSFRLLEGRQRPSETRDLYVLAGMASGMMANASHDLGDNHAALMQGRTAYVCADNAGHDGLRAWVRGIQSMVSYWAGWTHNAVKLAALGAEPAARAGGTVSAWIPALQARAWAVLGNAEEAGAAIQGANAARERVELNSFDVIGGKLTFPLARQLYYAADASSWLDGKDRATSDFAASAISAYGDLPANERSYVDETVARTDLALSRARRGELDGVQDAISPVLELSPSERIGGVVVNAVRVGAALREDRYRGAALASQLVEELEDFTQLTAAAVLNR